MAIAMAVCEALMIQRLAKELNFDLELIIESDASSAIAAAEKRGLLKFKNLAIKWLFVKELVAQKAIRMKKISTFENEADILTKPVDAKTMTRHLLSLRCFDASWLQ